MSDKEFKPRGFLIFGEYEKYFNRLSMSQRGEVISACLAFFNRGEIHSLDGEPGLLAEILLDKIQYGKESYREACKKRSEASKEWWRKTKENNGQPSSTKVDHLKDGSGRSTHQTKTKTVTKTEAKTEVLVTGNNKDSASFRLVGEPAKRPEHEKTRMTRAQFEEMFAYMKNPDLRKMAMDNALEKGFYEIIDEDSGDL